MNEVEEVAVQDGYIEWLYDKNSGIAARAGHVVWAWAAAGGRTSIGRSQSDCQGPAFAVRSLRASFITSGRRGPPPALVLRDSIEDTGAGEKE